MKTIRLSDKGVDIRLRVKDDDGNVVDISSATTKRFDFKKPDRTIYSGNGTFVTDGTDGLLSYKTGTGEINQLGIWEIQLYIVLSYGNFRSTITKFRVEEIINSA